MRACLLQCGGKGAPPCRTDYIFPPRENADCANTRWGAIKTPGTTNYVGAAEQAAGDSHVQRYGCGAQVSPQAWTNSVAPDAI